MGTLTRVKQAGAVFSEDLSSISSLRKRYTITGTPKIVDSPFGNAMSFDGTSDKVVIGNVFGTAKTVVMKCYLETTTEQLLDFDSGTITLEASSGTLSVSSLGDEVMYVNGLATSTITAGTWDIIAFTTATGVSVTNLQVATDNTNFGQIKCKDLILFDRELSTAEITDFVNGQVFDYNKNIILRYDMSNIHPPDIGWRNLGNDGTGISLTSAAIVDGIAGNKAIYFDGVADYVQIVDNIDIKTTSGSIAWMFKTPASTIGDYQYLYTSGSSSTDIPFITMRTRNSNGTLNIAYRTDGNVYSELTNNDVVADGEWHTLIWTGNGSTWTAFLDGVEATFSVASGSNNGGWIGSITTNQHVISGFKRTGAAVTGESTIGSFIMFDKVLTNIEAKDIDKRLRRGSL